MCRALLASLALALASGAVSGTRLTAQVVVHVQAGDRVRITSPKLSGEFTAGEVQSNRLVLAEASDSGPLEIPIDALTSLEVRRSRTRGHGAKIGAAIGVLVGAVSGAVWASQDGGGWFSGGEMAVMGGLGVGAAAGAAGALAGALFPGGSWDEVPLWSPPDITPNRDGSVVLSYSYRF